MVDISLIKDIDEYFNYCKRYKNKRLFLYRFIIDKKCNNKLNAIMNNNSIYDLLDAISCIYQSYKLDIKFDNLYIHDTYLYMETPNGDKMFYSYNTDIIDVDMSYINSKAYSFTIYKKNESKLCTIAKENWNNVKPYIIDIIRSSLLKINEWYSSNDNTVN